MRKQTGTVPKATTTTPKQQTMNLATATTPLQTMGVMGQTAAASRCSPLNIVASMQQQQQQQQQNQRHIHQQQHKNTEIVAPIRRELKDLNDYLLTAVTHNNNNNSNNYQQQQQHLQHLPDNTGGTNNSDLENSQENQQRFCYPVRPIPRRSRADGEQQQSQNDLQANSLGNLSTNINAAIGVVIPTTPNVTIISSTPATLPTLTSAITTGPTNSKTNNHQSSAQAFNWNQQLHNKLLLLQLQQIQQLFKEPAQANALLNLTNLASTNFIPTSVLNHNANELQNLLQLNTNQQRNNSNSLTNISSNRLSKSLKASDMVHEVNPNSSQREIVVNSASLEDVAVSESSDRAQSINSLHSNCETPTPDQSPTLEELQDRLVTSTRNIMNMQEQTEQLKRLQSTAKLHLNEMEKMRQQSNTNENNILDKICNGNDLDQSVEQIHSDMSLLVNRMKYLTTFIQHQNELSALLGDDGPESQAEQEALQRKLEDLRHQRDEMRQLVSELQDVNRTAEESAKEVRQRQLEQEKDVVEAEPVAATVKTSPTIRPVYNSERVVPIEYTRTLPIELIQELVPHTARLQEDEQVCLSGEALQQRESDIEAMKAQLKRLKEMMETVNMIESHTSRDPKLVGQEINRERSAAVTMPVEGKPAVKNSPDTEEDISRKVRILDEVTTDLRVQAESLQAERNRIEALKAEIERRKQQAAASAQLGEEALKRSSLTPTPAPKVTERNITSDDADRQQAQEDRERLKSEYEVKKKEFEILCQRLDQEEATDHTQTPSTRQEIVSEADDEAEDICDSDYLGSGNNNNNINTTNNNINNKFSGRASTPVVCGRGLLREVTESASLRQNLAKDSISSSGAVLSSNVTQVNQAGNSSQDGASLEGASLLSGSCRSFSMPPPMTEMGLNFPGPLPPPLPTAWNAQQYYYSIPISVPPPLPVPASTSNFNIKEPSTMPPSGGECICNGNNLGAATSSSTTSATTNLQLTSDPMLQQFIHTQQMLINSVCQCNQMLWHQQREIDSLNHTIRTLQDRILALTAAGHQVASTTGAVTFNSTDIDYNIRSESVPLPPPPPPPPTLTAVNMSNIPSSGHNSATLPNNLYMSSHRAHSEQPIAFGAGPRRMAPESYHNYPEQQKHHQQQEQQQQYMHLYHHNRRDYNFCTESQQYNASATNNQTNNQSVVNGQTSTTSALHYNNDIPNSTRQHSSPPPPPPPLVNASPVAPAPIFMHHHNNSIHQNNANLRTQNQQQHRSNINNLTTAAGGNTLNNQVPPGNRANNYWDNFRSYSRQNLLSTNSNKSNEEQQQQQQQQQQQDNEYATTRMTNGLMHRHQAPAPPSLASHTRMLCQQQQQHLDEISNNLNFDNNNMNSGYNKYLRVMQRSRINQQQQRQHQQQSSYQQQQQQQQQSDSSQHLSWLQQQQHHQQQQPQQQHIINTNDGSNNIAAAAATTTTTAATMYHNYNNINQGNKVSAKQISQLRNRNEDFNVPAIATTAEQLRQTATTNERYHNTSERDDSYFLNSPLNQRQQQDADYMLRPFQGMEDNTYDFNNCNEQLQQHHSYITMEVSNNSTNTHNRRENKNNDNNEDDDDDDDEEDTTTSEEIKRNLLVNALKNDKFTTKFYESIKEDVFRRLESMLLDKNNRSTVVASCSNSGNTGQQFLNNITNANNTRKMYLNEERRLHKQESGQQPKMETSNINSINDDYDYQLSVSTAAGEDNSTLVAVVEVEHDENEKPEEDCNNWCDDAVTSLNNCSPRAVNTDTNVSATSGNLRCSVHGITKNVTKKRKNQRKQDTNYNNNNTNTCNNNIGVITKSQQQQQQQQNETLNENLRGACSLAAQEHQQQKQKQNEDQLNEEKVGEEKNLICSSSSTPSTSTASSTPTNYSNTIITSIITKLRHHLHQDNNHINDARLSEIAKLTASVAQSSSFNNNGYNISAKRIYAKMKKLSFPRKRDEFLHWYQNYLQTNLFLMNNNAITGSGGKTNNNNNDDRDLAEADQNCSTANQQNANYTQNEARDSCKDKSKLVAAEFENQEIPDVENHKKDSEGACALLVSQQPPQSQEIVKDFKTEKENNEQKINTDVNASLNDDN